MGSKYGDKSDGWSVNKVTSQVGWSVNKVTSQVVWTVNKVTSQVGGQ